jgi:hypothetical protein
LLYVVVTHVSPGRNGRSPQFRGRGANALKRKTTKNRNSPSRTETTAAQLRERLVVKN